MYRCVTSVDGYPNKVYLFTEEGDFNQRLYKQGGPLHRHSTFQISLGNKEEAQDNAITEMVLNQICTSLLKYFQEMPVVSARKI